MYRVFFDEIKFCLSFNIIDIADYPTCFFRIEEQAGSNIKVIGKRFCEPATDFTNPIPIYSLMSTLRCWMFHWSIPVFYNHVIFYSLLPSAVQSPCSIIAMRVVIPRTIFKAVLRVYQLYLSSGWVLVAQPISEKA